MKRFDQINMIPFIDIMLVLMAIVLTTATFVDRGLIDVNLPVAQASDKMTEHSQHIEIAITLENELYFNGEPIQNNDLAARLIQHSNHTPVQLRVDKHSVFDTFMAVINILKTHQFDQVAIETLPSQS